MPDDEKEPFGLTVEHLADFEQADGHFKQILGDDEGYRPIPPEEVPAALEALLFASGDPLTIDQLHRILLVDRDKLRRTLDDLKDRYSRDQNRGILLREAEGSFVLATKPEQLNVLSRLFSPRHRPPLTAAAYETLAVIAYNQPVTRSQIEAVRGVNSDNVLGRLIERNLIRETGTLDAPGRPALFATTEQFLFDFGLRSVADLPPMEMLMYGSLRDIEQSLETAASQRRDNQVTIDQIVAAIVPPMPPVTEQLTGSESTIDSGSEEFEPVLAAEEIFSLSDALFGVAIENDSEKTESDKSE
jgi:segregation and condensation protein B